MGGSKHIGNASPWVAVCVAPDYCQVGNSVVPFDSFAITSNPTLASPNVLAQGVAVYRVGDMHQGVQADAGLGIPSGTSLGGGCVKFLRGETNVNINGVPVISHDSLCLLNCNAAGIGGALGRLVTVVAKAFIEAESPNPALRELLHEEWTPWYERAFETIDSFMRFDRPEMHREHTGTFKDVFIGFAKGAGNLPSDVYNLGRLVVNHASFVNIVRQKRLEDEAVAAFKDGDTVAANELANKAAGITSSGYVEDIFTLDNDRQRTGAGLFALAPVGAPVKLVAGRLGKWATNVFRSAKTLDRAPDVAKLAQGSSGKGGVYVTPKRVISGARELSRFDWKGAERAYELIRASDGDVAAIAKNTGISEARVARIKDHVFNRSHQLDDGVRRFDADPEIANAWRRMENGSHTPKDIDLMNHELFESKFEGIHKTDYRTAHDAANRSGRKSGLE